MKKFGRLEVTIKYTENQIIAAMKGTGGIVSQILNNLSKLTKVDEKYTRQALHKRINESETLQEAYTAEQERIGDLAESAFAKALQAEKDWAVKEWFKYKGWTRNYVQKQEVKNEGGLFNMDTLKIEIVRPDENTTESETKDSA